MNDLGAILGAFHGATGCAAGVWVEGLDRRPRSEVATDGAPTPDRWPGAADGAVAMTTVRGPALVAAVPGPRRAWLVVGPASDRRADVESPLRLLLPIVSHVLQASLEVEQAARELAERYEEINLLYTIGEILGRTLTLGEAAHTILTEISETVGADRASVLVHDPASSELRVVAALGAKPDQLPPIRADDPTSVTARVFRTLHPVILDAGEAPSAAEAAHRDGPFLSVPIVWTTPRGPEPLGVVNISGRKRGHAFSAGDQKLVAAIATQIGTAIQNARLVRASILQQRLAHEMQLAHDLQMKLLPSDGVLAPEAQVAAKVVPAESVGGDLYNLFRLGRGRVGVLIGDVSGHGYQAALIMALVMSAAAIHAQATANPSELLGVLLASIEEELQRTEMFLSGFYAVIDRHRKTLRYANAGHPSAFIIHANGRAQRLPALDPPLGMTDDRPSVGKEKWNPRGDLLLLFTDGVSDARNRRGERFGEGRVIEMATKHRGEPPARIVDRIIKRVEGYAGGGGHLRDDLTVVVLRS